MAKIFALTHHLRERFVQRTNKRFQHLQECRQPQCPKCETLLTEIRRIISREQVSLDQKILDSLRQAQECRCYINNTANEWLLRAFEPKPTSLENQVCDPNSDPKAIYLTRFPQCHIIQSGNLLVSYLGEASWP